MNRLYYGDCLAVMEEMPPESVDLIYLDPPFNSSRDYNAIYTDETDRPLPTQIEAFCDTWILDEDRERAIRQMPILMREAGIADEVAEFWRFWVKALRKTNPRMLAYLSYMVQRLLPMHGLLKSTGSIYLHCDPTASHYIKIMMDAIFGHENFRNEITWQRTESHNTADRYGNIADILLYYTKSSNATWNPQHQDYGEAQLSRFRHSDSDGRRYKLENLTAPRPNSTSGKFNWRGTLPGPTRGWGYNLEQLEAWWRGGRIRTKSDGTPRMDGLKVYLDEDAWKAASEYLDRHFPYSQYVLRADGVCDTKAVSAIGAHHRRELQPRRSRIRPFLWMRNHNRSGSQAGATMDRDRYCDPCHQARCKSSLAGAASTCGRYRLRNQGNAARHGRRARSLGARQVPLSEVGR